MISSERRISNFIKEEGSTTGLYVLHKPRAPLMYWRDLLQRRWHITDFEGGALSWVIGIANEPSHLLSSTTETPSGPDSEYSASLNIEPSI